MSALVLLREHETGFKQRHGFLPALSQGRDVGILTPLVKKYGAEKIREALQAYTASDDTHVREAGWSIPFFHSRVTRLLVGANGTGSKSGRSSITDDWQRESPGEVDQL